MSDDSFSMMELFRVEAENQTSIINAGVLDLERESASPGLLESLMRAAHSIKGAARIVNVPVAVTVAHAMEDCFSAAQKGLHLDGRHFDLLLKGTDQLLQVARVGELDLLQWSQEHQAEFEELAEAIRAAMRLPTESASSVREPDSADVKQQPISSDQPTRSVPEVEAPSLSLTTQVETEAVAGSKEPQALGRSVQKTSDEKVLRINAKRLDRLMGLAAEALVESRWLAPFMKSLVDVKRRENELGRLLDQLRWQVQANHANDDVLSLILEAKQRCSANEEGIIQQLEALDGFDRRSTSLSRQLYQEAMASRMRPFSEGVGAFPRMVRDIARDLGKDVRFEITGQNTQVDRDILDKLQAPLNHMLRNALDHGIEPAAERIAAGKPPQGEIRLDARHQSGMLYITVSDDGRGIDSEMLRREVVTRKLVAEDVASNLSETELYDFLYLPNFTLKNQITEISGRGVGLDVVLNTLQQIRGTIKTHSEPGRGTRLQLQLPLTLSVVRGLVVEISGDPYLFPLARVDRTLVVREAQIRSLEGRQYFTLDGENVGLVAASQVLELPVATKREAEFNVVVISDRAGRFGLVVDRFVAEDNFVIQQLDARLGKIRDITAATLLADGEPALILDVDDLARSIDRLISTGRLSKMEQANTGSTRLSKHILVVDDSLTVREVERKLLENRGYRVDVAVDGMDGWNAVRSGEFDLLISDVDMPRMNGIELVTMIKKDVQLNGLPVMIVSYKEREEDRQRGLEAGANYYLTKSSFQDETLLEAVEALIGEA